MQFFKLQDSRYRPTDRIELQAKEAGHPRAEDYIRLRWELEDLRRTIHDSFTDFDLVALPTQKATAPALDDMIRRNLKIIAGVPGSSASGGSNSNVGA